LYGGGDLGNLGCGDLDLEYLLTGDLDLEYLGGGDLDLEYLGVGDLDLVNLDTGDLDLNLRTGVFGLVFTGLLDLDLEPSRGFEPDLR